MMGSKIKAYLRQVKARTDESLLHAIAEALNRLVLQTPKGSFVMLVTYTLYINML